MRISGTTFHQTPCKYHKHIHRGTHNSLRPASRSSRARCLRASIWDSSSGNPLESLRACTEPSKRAAFLRQLDGEWTQAYESYTPSAAEAYLTEHLGQSAYNCMLAAVQNPGLAQLEVMSQVKPSISTLKSYNIDLPEIWHLLNKRPWVLSKPDALQRWLDFLSVYGLRSKDLCQFLLRASQELLFDSTVYRAGQVITYLKTLGIKDEFLSTRLIGLWPEVLSKDVDMQLRPVVLYLMNLGMEVPDVLNVVMQWPDVLVRDVDAQLKPFSAYLQGLGCGPTQVAEVIMECPHLLQFSADQVFAPRVEALLSLGITHSDLRQMVRLHTHFLAAKGGFRDQVEALQQAGLKGGDLRTVLVGCPRVLVENPVEIERKCEFLRDVVGGGVEVLVRHPAYLGRNLMQVIGPRWYFVQRKGALGVFVEAGGKLEAAAVEKLDVTAAGEVDMTADGFVELDVEAVGQLDAEAGKLGAEAWKLDTMDAAGKLGKLGKLGSEAGEKAGPEAEGAVGKLDLTRLVSGSDAEFCTLVNGSLNEYNGFRNQWEKDYTQRINLESENSLKEELARIFSRPVDGS